MFVDTHSHLFSPEFGDDLETVIDNAKSSGVDYIIVPAIDIETSKKVIDLTEKYDFIYGAVGIHPHESKNWDPALINDLDELLNHNKIVAIGEIGLDYYYDFSPRDKQIEALKAQLDLALKRNLPVVLHNREADEDMMSILKSYAGSGLRAQLHCFSGSLENANDLFQMHHYISFTGNITFNKMENLRQIVAHTSLDHILLETDSPYMSPVPFRGKRNEPAKVRLVAEKIAELHKITVEEVGLVTSFNAFKLFGIGGKKDIIYTYKIHNSLYINITNRCNADCVFCNRKTDPVVAGYNLHMSKSDEPPAEIYISEIGDPKQFDEIVFCGFGEPTIRWDVVKKIAKYVKDNGGRTRLNTNGHGNYINKKDITPELNHLIDIVSISLNAVDPKQYSEIMRLDSSFFNEMINFAKSAKLYVEKVVMSVVSISSINIEKARGIAEEKVGAEFRVREYF
jgi:TatD DNase family protein